MSRLKYFVITLCLILSVQLAAKAQNNFEAIESEKIAYITKELKLSPAEAQRFFPIYNSYNSEMWDLKKAKRGTKTPGSANSFSGGKRDVIAYDAQEVDIKKKYRNEFAKVVGQGRASQFFQVVEDFNNILRSTLQNRQNGSGRRR